MNKYRSYLPQLGDELFLTDGGLETTLIFHEGLALPCFAAFDLLKNEEGTAVLRRYFERYAELNLPTVVRAFPEGDDADGSVRIRVEISQDARPVAVGWCVCRNMP